MRSGLIRAVTLGAVAVALTAGCTSSSKKAVTPTKTGGTTVSSPARATGPTLVQGTLPKSVANDKSLRSNVVLTKCAAVAGGWGASGTAKNPGTSDLTYTIVVYFTTTSSTTLSFAQTTVAVAPGKTATWSASKKFPAVAQMLCPIVGVSGS